ncbi:hypothetical protein E3J62_07610 [candidate division TA06 bacterium]|uniref:DUF4145 domain-containing protein n=1 Tax=candidate division TA06 bacterium TaxID=2250710 RepID=A0A523USA6_UNCT6|nr:MAG: hypothetical protein E3J62_07610 [candidate division TA06 bacterium]
MIKRSIVGLATLGGAIWYLQGRKEGDYITHKEEEGSRAVMVKGAVEGFLKRLKKYDMAVTLRAAGDLRAFLRKIKDRKTGAKLTKSEAAELRRIITSLEKTFRAEAKGIHSFFTTDKMISMQKLTAKHEALFPKGVFSELSEIAKYDVGEAGLCIAFDRATAAAFHILRATEAVVREFYYRIVKRNRVSVLTWGNITSDLSKRKRKPSPVIMKNLDYIRDNFRNPTAHPEARYNIEQAQSLFNLCIDAMSKMIKDPLWLRE